MTMQTDQNPEAIPANTRRDVSDLLADYRLFWERRFDRLSAYLRTSQTTPGQ
ncbi:hypothetical protein J2R89_006332 [Bradyrhizobium elkanii]|jgi:hypothetical protein|nr:hypothetical protein [Bradyrhizobium elkanii]